MYYEIAAALIPGIGSDQSGAKIAEEDGTTFVM